MEFSFTLMHSDLNTPDPNPSIFKRWWRRVVTVVVTLFVCGHVFMMIVTNADLDTHYWEWRKKQRPSVVHEELGPIEHALGKVRAYESYAGLDQSWGMFTSPLWRTSPFLAAHVNLDDGTTLLVRSTNEPTDLTRFIRFQRARQRKLEHYLLDYDLRGTYKYPLWERYAAHFAKRWRQRHPDDPRRVESVTLIARWFDIPPPGERRDPYALPEVERLITIPLEPANDE